MLFEFFDQQNIKAKKQTVSSANPFVSLPLAHCFFSLRGDDKYRRASVIAQLDKAVAFVVFTPHVCVHMPAHSLL